MYKHFIKGSKDVTPDQLKCSGIVFDPGLPEPLYLQLADALHERIQCHTGEKCALPSVRTLAAELKIDRSTASKAYAELERRHVVSRVSAYKYHALPEARKRRNPFPNIAVVIPRTFSAYISGNSDKYCILQYITGIIDRAAEQNISTLMLQLPPVDTPAAEVDEFLNEIASKVEGAIHLGSRHCEPDPPLRKLFCDNRIPQVMISAAPKNVSSMGCVRSDITPAVEALAAQLRERGLSRAAVMVYGNAPAGAMDNVLVVYEASSRSARIIETLTRCGIQVPEEHILTRCSSYANIYNHLAALIRRKNLPDVICCQNDTLAVWCIQALERQGIRVPGDVSVTGCDNCAPAPWDERLTTIAMPFYELGKKAVEMLEELKQAKLEPDAMNVELPAALEIKETLAVTKKQETR